MATPTAIFHCGDLVNIAALAQSLKGLPVRGLTGADAVAALVEFTLHELRKTIEDVQEGRRFAGVKMALLVLHADESRLSVAERNAGIGYGKLYHALAAATGTVGFCSH